MQLNVLELHTGDLIEPCLKRVELRHAGKLQMETTEALYRGSLFHELVRLMHTGGHNWDRMTLGVQCTKAAAIVEEQATRDRKPLSEAVAAKKHQIQAEVIEWAIPYGGRLASLVAQGTVIGCELPIRWTLDVDGEPQDFATHLDLLWRREDGVLTYWDFKTGEESPTHHYLGRNLQFGLIWLMLRHGSVLLGDEWVEFGEWTSCWWVHIRGLEPYRKATKRKDQNGDEQVFKAGDIRPYEAILKPCGFHEDSESAVIEQLETRVRMFRAGHFPMSPDPVGCFLCPSNQHCPSFSRGGEE